MNPARLNLCKTPCWDGQSFDGSALLHHSIRSSTVPKRTQPRSTVSRTAAGDYSSVTRLSGTFFTSCSYLLLSPYYLARKGCALKGVLRFPGHTTNSVPRGCFIFELSLGTSWFLKIFLNWPLIFVQLNTSHFCLQREGGKANAGNRESLFRTS